MRFEDFVESSQRVGTVEGLAQLYAEAIASEGYENSVLGTLRGRRLGQLGWLQLPPGYADAYVANRWDQIDPVVFCSLRARKAFYWEDAHQFAKLSEEQNNFLEQCKELQVRSGIMFPIHGPNQQLDFISISRRSADSADRGAFPLLNAVTAQAWNRYQEITEGEAPGEQSVTLTPREADILRWCKDGKTRPQIAEILSITVRTVEFHLNNCMDKLGASNQLSAVIIALQKRLIEL